MDYLKIRELYHGQMKGRKHDGNWQFQYKDTKLYTPAGQLRYRGHLNGMSSNATVPNYEKQPINFEDLLGSLNDSVSSGSSSSSSTASASSKSTKTSSGSSSSSSTASTPPKSTSTGSTSDPRVDKIKEWKVQDEYSKLRKLHEPTLEEQVTNGLNDVKDYSKQLVDQLPKDEGRKIYGSYPNMTIEELNDKINRLSKERTYSDLIGDTKFIKSGKTKAREIIQTVGSIAGIAAMVAPFVVPLIKKKVEGGK